MSDWTPEAVLRGILDDPFIQKLGSWRLRGERALAAATGTAKTPQAVECEASQSGTAKRGNAQ